MRALLGHLFYGLLVWPLVWGNSEHIGSSNQKPHAMAIYWGIWSLTCRMLCAYSIGAPIGAGQIYREKHYCSLVLGLTLMMSFDVIVRENGGSAPFQSPKFFCWWVWYKDPSHISELCDGTLCGLSKRHVHWWFKSTKKTLDPEYGLGQKS